MSPLKEAVIRLVQALPDDCTIEDIQYQLYLRDKLQRGLKDMEEGRVVSEEEADRRIDEWLSSLGPD